MSLLHSPLFSPRVRPSLPLSKTNFHRRNRYSPVIPPPSHKRGSQRLGVDGDAELRVVHLGRRGVEPFEDSLCRLSLLETHSVAYYGLLVPLVADPQHDQAAPRRPSLAPRSNATVATITLTTPTAIVALVSQKSKSGQTSRRRAERIKLRQALLWGRRKTCDAAHPLPRDVGGSLYTASRYRLKSPTYQKKCLFASVTISSANGPSFTSHCSPQLSRASCGRVVAFLLHIPLSPFRSTILLYVLSSPMPHYY